MALSKDALKEIIHPLPMSSASGGTFDPYVGALSVVSAAIATNFSDFVITDWISDTPVSSALTTPAAKEAESRVQAKIAPPVYPPCVLPPSFAMYRNLQQYHRYSQCQWQNMPPQHYNQHVSLRPTLPPPPPPPPSAAPYGQGEAARQRRGQADQCPGERHTNHTHRRTATAQLTPFWGTSPSDLLEHNILPLRDAILSQTEPPSPTSASGDSLGTRMEIMQQGTNHLDSRWRSHMIPYGGHGLALPTLHDHLRQHLSHQQTEPRQEHVQESHHQHSPPSDAQHLQLQQQQSRQEQQRHQSRTLLQQRHQQQHIAQSQAEHSSSRGGGTAQAHTSQQQQQLTALTPLQSSPSSAPPSTPTPPTPSPGKSGKDGEEKKEGGEWEQYNAGAAFLGPTLWDKTLSYDSDLKVSLEYMDLDEFLNENGIPLDENGKRTTSASSGGSSTNSTSNGTGGNLTLGSVLSPEAPSSPESPQRVGSGMGVAGGPQTPVPLGHAAAPITVLPPALSPQECSLDGYPSSPESSVSLDPHDPLQVHEPEAARASQGREIGSVRGLGAKLRVDKDPVSRKATGEARQPSAGDVQKGVAIDFSISPNDLALATVPGQDFDPRTRSFTEDELKPQPMIKKSRKQFVPSELKDDKYWARRRKNNMAAKRSRDARRLKENQIAMRANFLEKENVALRLELEKTVKEVETLKSRLEKYEGI
ncbi:hormone receptor 4-like [Penaeus japonicus]|uniref:hormone receptor 4-like n=1 Tax=Penaeus japonicus TaxID=27405 RepID=UPI001C7117D1|nr:hormone receptor 4-like [Penaeus japonicus]